MDILWQDSTDPSSSLNKADKHVMYDDHNYIKYTATAATRDACEYGRPLKANIPLIIILGQI